VCCSMLQCVAVCCSMLQCVAVCCSMLQCVAVCCSVLQCVAVNCQVVAVLGNSSCTVRSLEHTLAKNSFAIPPAHRPIICGLWSRETCNRDTLSTSQEGSGSGLEWVRWLSWVFAIQISKKEMTDTTVSLDELGQKMHSSLWSISQSGPKNPSCNCVLLYS